MNFKILSSTAVALTLLVAPAAIAQTSSSPGGAPAVAPEPGRASDPQSTPGAVSPTPSTTGAIGEADMFDEERVRASLAEQGYTDVGELGVYYTTTAVRNGQPVTITVDARTGRVVD